MQTKGVNVMSGKAGGVAWKTSRQRVLHFIYTLLISKFNYCSGYNSLF